MSDVGQLFVVYGVVAVVALLLGTYAYVDPYAGRIGRRLAARVILAAPVWPLAVPVAVVVFLARAIPRVVRDAFRKD